MANEVDKILKSLGMSKSASQSYQGNAPTSSGKPPIKLLPKKKKKK